MEYIFQENSYQFDRYPQTQNHTLRAWNAGEEYMIQYLASENWLSEDLSCGIFHDRFGFLTTLLHNYHPVSFLSHRSQQKAILSNLQQNNLEVDNWHNKMVDNEASGNFKTGLMVVPKSLDLWEYYLASLHHQLDKDGQVIASFMTRHFSKRMLDIPNQYFHTVEQTRARKKSRLLLLKNKIDITPKEMISTIVYQGHEFQQWPGVFSADKIDIASQLLIDHLHIKSSDKKILDLGCGNGILAFYAQIQQPEAEIHLVDDFYPAILSAKLNLRKGNVNFHWSDDLSMIADDYLDLVITNPPFHFEHEQDINIPLQLFNSIHSKLKKGGRLLLVANAHLNYPVHLQRAFDAVNVVFGNKRFMVVEAVK